MLGTRSRGTVVEEPVVRTTAWSPAQLVALVIGGASIAFGVFALTRTGLPLDELTGHHDSVLSFHHTPLLGLLEVAWGVLLVLAGLRPIAGRALMALLGALAVALGVITVLDFWPRRLHDWLAVHDRNGWLFIVAGGIVLAAALFLPVVQSAHTTRQRTVAAGGDDEL